MSEPTPETHVFVGTFRPPWEKCWANSGCSIHCTCGQILQCAGQPYKHWQQGCYDTPVYKTIEEVLAIQAAAKQGQGET